MSFRASNIRSVLLACMFVSGFFFPWYITLACAFALTVRFRAWEIVWIAALLDLFWMPASFPEAFPYMTVIALGLVIALEPLRRQLLATEQFGI